MNKLVIISLFYAVCPVIYSMDPEESSYVHRLPSDIKGLLLPKVVYNTIVNSATVVEAVNKAKELEKIFPTIPGNFEEVLKMLHDKFPKEPLYRIAAALGTAQAKEWLNAQEVKFIEAIKGGDLTTVKELVLGGYVSADQSNYGVTPLMLAIDYNQEKIARFLLSQHANVNRQNKHGIAALMIAIFHNNIPLARLLLTYDANPNLKNRAGYSALYIAKKRGFNDMMRILQYYNH